MKRLSISIVGVLALSGLTVVACGNSDGDGSTVKTTAAAELLTSVDDLEPGDGCEFGGVSVSMGADADADGSLAKGEITNSYNVCNGEVGASGSDASNALSSSSPASAEDCPTGGTSISFGVDEDGDGELGSSEVQDTVLACNGDKGEDSCPPVIRTTIVEPGGECATGGFMISFGQDSGAMSGGGGAGGASSSVQCDGILGDDEVEGTQYVCNGAVGATGATGADGADGADGATGPQGPAGASGGAALLKTGYDILACDGNGGVLVHAGNDDNGNGNLEAGEIDSSITLCETTLDVPPGCRPTDDPDIFICISQNLVNSYATASHCEACVEHGMVNACTDLASCTSHFTNEIIEDLYLERTGTACTAQTNQTGGCGWGEIMTANYLPAGSCPTPQDCSSVNWASCTHGVGSYAAHIYGVCTRP